MVGLFRRCAVGHALYIPSLTCSLARVVSIRIIVPPLRIVPNWNVRHVVLIFDF